SDGKIPELKRVIVAYQNRIVMADTLENALARIFAGQGTAQPSAPASLSSAAIPTPRSQPSAVSTGALERAREHYQRAMQAQRDGNWALYGEEIKLLGDTLQEMSK